MRARDELRRLLGRLDGRGYKAYGDLRGAWSLGAASLFVDRVQSDPFASPSRVRLRVPAAHAALPPALAAPGVRRLALADFLARAVRAEVGGGAKAGGTTSATRGADAAGAPRGADADARFEDRRGRPRGGPRGRGRERDGAGSGRSGEIEIDAGGQTVLERTAVRITDDWVEARLEIGLPAAGRRVLGRAAERLLLERLPEIAEGALAWPRLDEARGTTHVRTVENHHHLARALRERGLIAFVADGAVLPRESGASDRPMPAADTRPFRSPEALRVTLPLVNPIDGPGGPTDTISGMGLPRGVTLIVGGGYHGKSTLLRALEHGVYPHVPGDGREYVVSDPDLVKIRAEDGRAVTGVDLRGFVDAIPSVRAASDQQAEARTRHFRTADASGSTSQAAAIVEALEAGARGLLLDEDTSATNFMVRDARMQRLVRDEHEPITPFVDRVRELYETRGLSTVLVMGGSGDYFDVADTVVRMRDFLPEDATAEAHAIARETPNGRRSEAPAPLGRPAPRVPLAGGFDASRGRRAVKIAVRSREQVAYGRETVDLRHVTQLVDPSQTRAAALAVHAASVRFMARAGTDAERPETALGALLDRLEAMLDAEGLEALDPDRRGDADERHPGRLARPRRHEIAALVNRLRTLRIATG